MRDRGDNMTKKKELRRRISHGEEEVTQRKRGRNKERERNM